MVIPWKIGHTKENYTKNIKRVENFQDVFQICSSSSAGEIQEDT